jgi:hypothetical protein
MYFCGGYNWVKSNSQLNKGKHKVIPFNKLVFINNINIIARVPGTHYCTLQFSNRSWCWVLVTNPTIILWSRKESFHYGWCWPRVTTKLERSPYHSSYHTLVAYPVNPTILPHQVVCTKASVMHLPKISPSSSIMVEYMRFHKLQTLIGFNKGLCT